MKIKEVARRMEKSELFVREGLKQGLFDFGYAISVITTTFQKRNLMNIWGLKNDNYL